MKRPTERLPRLLALVAFWLLASLAQAVDVVTYLHTDVAGTPLLATDASGAVVWKENYQPFGGRLNHPPAGDNDQWFAGKPYDSGTGLSYFGARYYDPLLGRFLGLDPAPVDPGDIHGLSKYSYGNNNPYRYVDPDGRAPLDAILFHVGGGALVGGAMAGTFNAAAQYASTGTVRWGGLGGLADALGEGAMIGAVLGPLMAAEGIAARGSLKGVEELAGAAAGKARSSGDIVVQGGRDRAKELFREFDVKGVGNRTIGRDKTGGGRSVEGALEDGTALRIRMKPDGTTRIQAGDQKFIFPPN